MNRQSYFGRVPSGGNVEAHFEMNLKGFDRWEQGEPRQRDEQIRATESDWLTNRYIQQIHIEHLGSAGD